MLAEKELDKEYAGIMGYETFRKAAVQIAFGPGFDFIENGEVSVTSHMCVCVYHHSICLQYTTAQTISGTGSLRLAANYLVI